jgi:hypothetical protein
MQVTSNSFLVMLHLAVATALGNGGAYAQIVQGSPSIALKSGESQELGNVYYTINCRSFSKGPPRVEVLEGPPGVTVMLKEGMVLPRYPSCANRVPGGTLVISAKDIEDHSQSAITIRVTFKTKDGDRSFSQIYNVSLLP